MSPVDWRFINLTGLIVIVQIFAFKRFFWDAPLKHGPGFFFDVEVLPGFYDGTGGRWLKIYRALILAVNLVLALALVALLISGRWHLLPAWAGSVAVSHIAALWGFRAYARAKLGRNPTVQARAAVSLEARRLGDHLSWTGEAFMAGIIALCWTLLLVHGNGQVRWSTPVLLTYVVVGLFLLEIGFVRTSFPPLPAASRRSSRGTSAVDGSLQALVGSGVERLPMVPGGRARGLCAPARLARSGRKRLVAFAAIRRRIGCLADPGDFCLSL